MSITLSMNCIWENFDSLHVLNLAAVAADDVGGLISSWSPTFHTTTLKFLYSTVSASGLIVWTDAVSVHSLD